MQGVTKDEHDSGKLIGAIHESKNFGKFEIVDYMSYAKVRVRFLNTGYETIVTYRAVIYGTIRDKLAPEVFGVGFTDGEYTLGAEGKNSKVYRLWYSMLERCYCEKSFLKHPTYKNCEVGVNFRNFSYFKDWCNRQIGYGNEGWHLDKDILVKGNKVYSEDTCCFVPKEINVLLIKSNARRGEYPIGVGWNRQAGKFRSWMSENNRRKHLGCFTSIADAFKAYKIAKEAHIRKIASKYKDALDLRVYDALMNWVIEIED